MTQIDPGMLNSRPIENYKFAKLSAILADYGFNTMRLSADWNGADLIAQYQRQLVAGAIAFSGASACCRARLST